MVNFFADCVCGKFTQDREWQDKKSGTKRGGMVLEQFDNSG